MLPILKGRGWLSSTRDSHVKSLDSRIRSGAKSTHLVGLLRKLGPQLGRPQVDTLKGSKHSNLKELRFRADNGAWRVAFSFDLRRQAVLLVGGDKSGVSKGKFYRNRIEIADRRLDQHLRAISAKKEKQ